MTAAGDNQEALYRDVVSQYGAALARLARGYEANPHLREDLLQDIHVAIWSSLRAFEGRCSLRTWVYRVAHNTAVSRVTRSRRRIPWVSLDDVVEQQPAALIQPDTQDAALARRQVLALVEQLAPPDRQIVLLYLEDVDAAAIGEIVGLSATNVATKIHRIKKILAARFHAGSRS